MAIRMGWVAAGILIGVPGCTAGNSTLRPLAAYDLPNQDQKVDAALSPNIVEKGKSLPPKVDCELRLFAEQLSSGDCQGISAGALGTFIVEREADDLVVPGVCIKKAGEDLQLPTTILIASDREGPELKRFCRDEVQEELFVVPPHGSTLTKPQRIKSCTWDGTFHSTRPFTFTLLTDKSVAVADYVEALRIYRNGDLMAAWNYVSDQREPHRITIDGTMLKTNALAATYPPHLAAMDLRIVPRQPGDDA